MIKIIFVISNFSNIFIISDFNILINALTDIDNNLKFHYIAYYLKMKK